MKKLFASIVATVMAASFALPLAACGGGGELVSERLPENNFDKEWKAAFSHLSDENIKIEFEVICSSEEWAEDIETKEIVVRNGNMERWTAPEHTSLKSDGVYIVPASDMFIDFSADPPKVYACGSDGVFHACQPDGEWKSLAEYMSMELYESQDWSVTRIREWGIWDEDMEEENRKKKPSELFHYSEKDGGYVATKLGEGQESTKDVVKFKDGKIVQVFAERSGYAPLLGDHVTYSWTVTYGGQEVHLPSDEECDHGVRAMQSDILPEAGFAEAVEKAFDIYDSENIKIEFGGLGMQFYSGKLIHADKKEYYFSCSMYKNRSSYEEGYCDLRGETPVGFLQHSSGSRQEYNVARFGEGIERLLLYSHYDFSEIKSAPQKLHYSEADKGYVWGDNKYIVKFKNGKIASIYGKGGYGDYSFSYGYMIFTYGGQTVTLPDMSAE